MIRLSSLLLIFFGCVTSLAQQPTYIQFTVEDGLPSNEVYHVMEDSQGYLWFCTDHGVCRYDGHTFQHITTAHGLINNTVFKCVEDERGRVWFLTFDSRLCYFRNGKVWPYRYNDKITALNIPSIAKEFMIVEDEHVIVVTSGVSYEIDSRGNAQIYRDTSGLHIRHTDKNYYMFVGYENWSNNDVNHVDVFHQNGERTKISRTGKARYCVFQLEKSAIFSTIHDVFRITRDTLQHLQTISNMVSCLFLDSDNQLWLGYTDSGGAVLVDDYRNNWTIRQRLLTDKSISAILEDREGGFWFTTIGEGVFYAPNLMGITSYSGILPDAEISDMCSDHKGGIYLGYANGAIWHLEENTKTFVCNTQTSVVHGGDNPIYYDTTQNKLYHTGNLSEIIERNRELIARDFSRFRQVSCPSEFVGIPYFKVIESDSPGVIWVGSNLYLFSFADEDSLRLNRLLMDKIKEDPGRVYLRKTDAIVPNFLGDLWVSTVDGLIRFQGDTAFLCSEEHPILANRFDAMRVIDNKYLFLGSRGSGVIIYTEDQLYHLDESDGLTSNMVNAIAADKSGSVWVGTNSGLNRITRDKDGKYHIRQFTTAHGLLSNHISSLTVTGNTLWIGTIHGLYKMNIDRLKTNKVAPIVHLLELFVNGQSLGFSKNLNLDYNQNTIAIRFTGITFNNGKNIEYSYRLTGLENNWQVTKTPFVRYNSLEPGEYKLMVKARNADGYWSEPITYSFSILPPFWKRWWFMAISFSLVVLTVVWIIRRRDKLVAEKAALHANHEKETTQLKLQALRAQMNPHFTFNTLNSIQNYIAANDSEQANIYLAKFADLVRSILDNSAHNLISLENEIELVSKYLDLEKVRFHNKLDYRIYADPSIDLYEEQIPPTVLQPFVENAIIHGIMPLKGNGLIEISLSREADFILCKIKDNGVGREKATEINKKKGWNHRSVGISNGASRIELIRNATGRGSVKIVDLYDDNGFASGTQVEIRIPIMD